MDTSTLPSSADAYGALQAFNSARPTATDYISKANSQYNIPQDQQQVTGLQGTLNNLTSSLQAVAPSVIGRTSGTFTTAGQQSALVNKEQAPIATNITNTGTSLASAQGVQGHDEQLAAQMVQALLGQDATKYQGLMDTYNAASDSEKMAESKRQFDADLAEKAREANMSSSGNSDIGSIISALGGKGAAADTAAKDQAYSSVQKFITGTDAQIRSDYAATIKSANKGNAVDQLKVQLYRQARPDLFSTDPKSYSTGGGSPSINWSAAAKAAPSGIANFLTKPGSGNLSTGNFLNNLKQWF